MAGNPKGNGPLVIEGMDHRRRFGPGRFRSVRGNTPLFPVTEDPLTPRPRSAALGIAAILLAVGGDALPPLPVLGQAAGDDVPVPGLPALGTIGTDSILNPIVIPPPALAEALPDEPVLRPRPFVRAALDLLSQPTTRPSAAPDDTLLTPRRPPPRFRVEGWELSPLPALAATGSDDVPVPTPPALGIIGTDAVLPPATTVLAKALPDDVLRPRAAPHPFVEISQPLTTPPRALSDELVRPRPPPRPFVDLSQPTTTTATTLAEALPDDPPPRPTLPKRQVPEPPQEDQLLGSLHAVLQDDPPRPTRPKKQVVDATTAFSPQATPVEDPTPPRRPLAPKQQRPPQEDQLLGTLHEALPDESPPHPKAPPRPFVDLAQPTTTQPRALPDELVRPKAASRPFVDLSQPTTNTTSAPADEPLLVPARSTRPRPPQEDQLLGTLHEALPDDLPHARLPKQQRVDTTTTFSPQTTPVEDPSPPRVPLAPRRQHTPPEDQLLGTILEAPPDYLPRPAPAGHGRVDLTVTFSPQATSVEDPTPPRPPLPPRQQRAPQEDELLGTVHEALPDELLRPRAPRSPLVDLATPFSPIASPVEDLLVRPSAVSRTRLPSDEVLGSQLTVVAPDGLIRVARLDRRVLIDDLALPPFQPVAPDDQLIVPARLHVLRLPTGWELPPSTATLAPVLEDSLFRPPALPRTRQFTSPPLPVEVVILEPPPPDEVVRVRFVPARLLPAPWFLPPITPTPPPPPPPPIPPTPPVPHVFPSGPHQRRSLISRLYLGADYFYVPVCDPVNDPDCRTDEERAVEDALLDDELDEAT